VNKPIAGWRVTAMDLWFAPGQEALEPINRGFGEALSLLRSAELAHRPVVRLHENSAPWERLTRYQSVRAARRWRLAIGTCFGGSGQWFGTRIPALTIRFSEEQYPCVAPHIDLDEHWPRQTRTILGLLQLLGLGEQLRLFGRTVPPT